VAPIRWVEKSGSTRVRITINLRRINEYFAREASSIVLQTLQSQRHKFGLPWAIGFDQHSSYYQHRYHDSARQWLGFSVHDDEIPAEAKKYLWKHHGVCRHGQSWVFTYAGLAMGCAPSCKQYSEPMEALMAHWARCAVRPRGATRNATWESTSYIDDSAFIADSFEAAVELALRLLCEYTMLGFSINFDKSMILPRREITHLGIRCCSRSRRFSLPPKRVVKLNAAVGDLAEQAVVGEGVPARLVARVVGNLWSVHVVAHRCVAIMCRSMIDTLAVALRRPDLVNCKDPSTLRFLLKQVWAGHVVWTKSASEELHFWQGCDFAALSAPMSFDALRLDLETFFVQPNGTALDPDVQILASDTSDTASGGGEFIAVNCELWQASRFFSPLSDFGVRQSSTYRETPSLTCTMSCVGKTVWRCERMALTPRVLTPSCRTGVVCWPG
jgi:hypothetical protein